MKPSIVLFIVIFLLLQSSGCKKETVGPVPNINENREAATNTNEPIDRVTDTTNIVQWPPSPGEIIIENSTWIFPWYNSIAIADFDKKLPSVTSFKVFIQRGNSSVWTEVPLISNDLSPAIKYEYFVEKRPDGAGIYNFGSLYIFYYGNDVSDNPSVKIEY